MPPFPPRRSARDFIVPRDVTETARQGQGIGDIEAIRQMAGVVGKQALGMLPVTGEAMAANDFREAARQRDKIGMALAALSIAAAPAIGKVAKAVRPAAQEIKSALEGMSSASREAYTLPMDQAYQMARATEQGFTTPVYHATSSTTPIDELRPSNGNMMDLNAVHVGTKKTANDRAGAVHVLSTPSGHQYQSAKAANTQRGWTPDRMKASIEGNQLKEGFAPSILPLLAKIEKPYLNPATNAPWTERDFQRHVSDWIRENAPKLGETDRLAAKRLMKQDLLNRGYDAIPYINAIEGGARYKSGHTGDVSYMMLKPENLRSQFAKFDPANVGKAGLMGGLAALLTGGATFPANQTNQNP